MGRTQRLAILSIGEQQTLRKVDEKLSSRKKRAELADEVGRREISSDLARTSKRFNDLIRQLPQRLEALPGDLEIIIKSKSLRPTLKITNIPISGILMNMNTLTKPEFGASYEKKRIRTCRIDGSICYWLDENVKPKPTIKNIFTPEYALIGVKNRYMKSRGRKKLWSIHEVLVSILKKEEATRKPILPRKVRKAKPIDELQKSISYQLIEAYTKPVQLGTNIQKGVKLTPFPKGLSTSLNKTIRANSFQEHLDSYKDPIIKDFLADRMKLEYVFRDSIRAYNRKLQQRKSKWAIADGTLISGGTPHLQQWS